MVTNDDHMVALRQLRKTTHVRVTPSDARVLDDIASMLNTVNPGVRYKRSDAINWLIGIAKIHGRLPLSAQKNLYTETE